MRTILLGLVAFFAFNGNAWAWGAVGHQVVCEIAFRLAEPGTRAEIRELMKKERDYDFFSQTCVWADKPPQVDTRGDEHFVNLPRDAKRLTADSPCPVSSPCVLTAIDKDRKTLASKNADPKERLEALKFLGHWVGDVHQPLHVSFKDDKGGNYVDVEYAKELKLEDCKMKLHSAWDTCLVIKLLGADVSKAAAELMEGINPAKIDLWTEDSDPLDWANESFRIATDQQSKYCVRDGSSCKGGPEPVVIDEAYLKDNGPIIKERLQRASVRLAKLLDETLSK